MMESSPFALATVPDKPPETPKDLFTANWKVTGMMKLPADEQGVSYDWVSIRSQDQRVAFTLSGGEASHDPEADGVTIDHIERNPVNPRKSKVFLKKGSEVAPVDFGEEPLAAAPPPTQIPPASRGNPAGIRPPGVNIPGMVRPGVQPQPMQSPGVLRPPGAALNRPGLPHTGNTLPMQSGIQGSGQIRPPGAPQGSGLQQQPGKRIRVIPSGPQ
jgi:hypothetical protein